jgi:hypothetical protein
VIQRVNLGLLLKQQGDQSTLGAATPALLYRESEGRTIAEVALELGVGAETFRKWVRQDEADRGERSDRPPACSSWTAAARGIGRRRRGVLDEPPGQPSPHGHAGRRHPQPGRPILLGGRLSIMTGHPTSLTPGGDRYTP